MLESNSCLIADLFIMVYDVITQGKKPISCATKWKFIVSWRYRIHALLASPLRCPTDVAPLQNNISRWLLP
jgi:hypothetical protein